MAPKSLHPGREVDWNNFLLGCTNCNSVKGDSDVPDGDILWPDRDNTLLALAYSPGGYVRLASGVGPELRRRAQALVDLVGLDRHGWRGGQQLARRDRRWEDRDEAWAHAEQCRANFEALGRSDEARGLVIDAARYCGFFSVWFDVFDRHVDVKLALIDAFSGTAKSCFGQDGSLINRPGGAI